MPILALHGFTGLGSDFAPFAELCGGHWHCPNLPGHGPEPELDCRPEAHLKLIDEQAARLGNTQPKRLLGYSMGARAALLHALQNPQAWEALILISPNPGIEDPAARKARSHTDEKLAQRIERDGSAAFIEFWQQTPMIRSQQSIRPDWRQPMQAARATHTAQGLATSLRQFGQGHCPNLWPALEQLKMPCLLITGSEDVKYTAIAHAITQRLPQPALQSTLIPAAGHMPQLEAAEATAAALHQFFESENLKPL